MLCHMLLHIASSALLSGLHGAVRIGISILFTVLRLGIPILIMKFGGKKLALGDYSCNVSFGGPEYFAVFAASFTAIFLFRSCLFADFPIQVIGCSGYIARAHSFRSASDSSAGISRGISDAPHDSGKTCRIQQICRDDNLRASLRADAFLCGKVPFIHSFAV